MRLEFVTLDVFTDRPFSGNPLAVVLDAGRLSDRQMQTVAREFNLSETIFVMAPADPANAAKVRIFLPAAEIPFAGHPTVGCAILLASRQYKEGCSFETEIRLEEAAGLVPVRVSRIGAAPRAMFTAPVLPFVVEAELPGLAGIARALALEPADLGFAGHRPRLVQGGPRCLQVPVASRAALAGARPIEPHWSTLLAPLGTGLVYLYTPGGDRPQTDFRARMFAPTQGVPEDPATGAATALLAAQLMASQTLAEGTRRFELEQGYEMGRPSQLQLEADIRGGKLAAVRVAGQAVQIMQGMLDI